VALNRDKIGVEYEPFRYEVCREKIREYATALGETDPRYYSDGDDCVAPPTFAAAFTIVRGGAPLFADPDLGAHWTLVHGAQAYEFGDRPVRPGDAILCTPKITDITYRVRHEFLTLEIDCRFENSGERAVRSTNTIIFLGSAPTEDKEEKA
jgi:hypothetical protein